MGFKLGTTDFINTKLGTAQIKEIRLGNTLVKAFIPNTPTINMGTIANNSVQFTITNNSPYEVTVYYELNDNTPDLYSVVIAANSTCSTRTISGLSQGTGYFLYAWASVQSGLYSTVDVESFTTTASGATNWVIIGVDTGDPYNGTVTRTNTVFSCPDTNAVDTWLTNSYPPSNYSIGYVMRVSVYQKGGSTFCGYYFYEAQ